MCWDSLHNARRYDDARGAFAAQYGVDANRAAAYLLAGGMLLDADLPELAAQDAQKALEVSPGLPLAHFMLGEVYLYKSDVGRALDEFQKERALNPGIPWSMTVWAMFIPGSASISRRRNRLPGQSRSMYPAPDHSFRWAKSFCAGEIRRARPYICSMPKKWIPVLHHPHPAGPGLPGDGKGRRRKARTRRRLADPCIQPTKLQPVQ